MKYKGKKYISVDNSYMLNLTQEETDLRLAGTWKEDPKEALIVSEPYKEEIINVVDKRETHLFINVKYLDYTIRVLFYESGVDADLEERIKESNSCYESYNYNN